MSSAIPSPPPSPTFLHLHLRTRFRTRPVRNAHLNRAAKLLCATVLTLLFAAAFVLFLLYLALRPHRPRFHVSTFSASDLSSHSPSFNAQISIRNPNEKIGMYFGPIAGSVYYRDEPVGPEKALAGAFYQPPKNTTAVGGMLGGGQVGEIAAVGMATDLAAGAVAFRIELASTVRFKVSAWDTHRHKMHASCGVKVGGDGEILPDYKQRRCQIYFF